MATVLIVSAGPGGGKRLGRGKSAQPRDRILPFIDHTSGYWQAAAICLAVALTGVTLPAATFQVDAPVALPFTGMVTIQAAAPAGFAFAPDCSGEVRVQA